MQKKYLTLNSLAAPQGTVVFGGSSDKDIPLGELKQAFGLSSYLYNRSFDNLSVNNAAEYFDLYIAPLSPERILLHIGESDTELFSKDSVAFDTACRKLIAHIKAAVKDCEVVIISQNTADNCAAEMNKHLKYISQSECCEFIDVSAKRIWNPQQTKDVMSFLDLAGINIRQPVYDLAKILFCYNNSYSTPV